jgi:tryptophan synthase beta chain
MIDYQQPNNDGYFGEYGGIFVAETLMQNLEELHQSYQDLKNDPDFWAEYQKELNEFVGRPSLLYEAKNISQSLASSAEHLQKGEYARIFFKREDLNHTGAHKINNVIGQILVAKKMGKTRIIAETGAGQHGVATATICARYGLECVIYMGARDVARQAVNVQRMQLMGAKVVPVQSGSQTLKDALNEAMRDWVANVDDTFYMIGTVAGPHPYPAMVRDFQKVIGEESIAQFESLNLKAEGYTHNQPDYVVACVGGGSNAIGIFYPYLGIQNVQLIGVEAAGAGMDTKEHSCSIQKGRPGILHGNKTYVIQDEAGQVLNTHSVSAGLDYPGVGPEHAHLNDIGRVQYVGVNDKDAIAAFLACAKSEGIIAALETSHALAYATELAKKLNEEYAKKAEVEPEQNIKKYPIILVNLSGRGDKDLHTVEEYLRNI